ncbi:FecR family protein [Chitinophaga niabensis]|uniref:Ferric-dicitrate binding protein FerR, regulates iron transport through sigma-19 n=1 Tax=Chitinophaga niabensis TaxID=536979 RepID=A0A1N6F5H2_9BACT|nr:FecR family protein [Chitinophaga niabensis]SIN90500.1 ferric-dicitrate binding protein FerR, regulates iron transport through sigma-19 [Chitinophaga niabensis]
MQTDRFIWLLTRQLSGEISAEEQKELETMLLAEPSLRKAREALVHYWHSSHKGGDEKGTRNAFDKLVSRMDATVWPAIKPPTSRRWWIPLLGAAAVLVLCAAALLWLLKEPALTSEYNTRGTRSLIKLADGTTVWLNADSELKYPARFKNGLREVYLKGEAYFDVAKDAERPFIVHTDKMDVNVLGTSFNVRSYPDDSTSEATLISGVVEVALATAPGKKFRLKPAEKFIIANKQDSVSEMPGEPVISGATYFAKEDSVIVETAWVDNKLIFSDESFANLATRMERWYNVTIQFENTAIQQLRFTGLFKKETLIQALEALQLTEGFNYKIIEDRVIIY